MNRLMVLAAADEKELAEKLTADLVELEYNVVCPDSREIADLRNLERVDLFILIGQRAAMLERLAGELERDDVLAEIPVMVLTEERVLERFDYCRWADDFLLYPYRVTELAARIRMLMWRNHKVDPSSEVRAGGLVLNLSTYEVTEGGRTIDLTFKEYELLRYLVTHRGRVYTRQHLLAKVWGEDYYGGPRTVDVHIRRIRSKIEAAGQAYIQTVRSVGYRFVG